MCSGDKYGPVGYTYNADVYCMTSIAEIAIAEIRKTPLGLNYPNDTECQGTECILDVWASVKGIKDRRDEGSFDSGDFPKAVLYHSACDEDHDICGAPDCGTDLCNP